LKAQTNHVVSSKSPGMIRTLLVSLMVIIPVLHCPGQEIYYYAANYRPVKTEKEALSVQEIHQRSENKYDIETRIRVEKTWIDAERQKIRIKPDGTIRIRIKGDRLFPEKVFREITKLEPGLYYFEETVKGITRRTGTSNRYLPLLLEGIVNEFHPKGQKKSVSVFKDNQLISNKNWLPDGSLYIDSIYYSADQEPKFSPGQKFFNSYLMQQLKKSKINLEEYEDRVLIGWVIMENGLMDGVIALEGKSLQLNQILVDIIAEMPGAWEPAILDGNPVRYFMSIPLNFMHHDAKFQHVEFSSGVLHYNRY